MPSPEQQRELERLRAEDPDDFRHGDQPPRTPPPEGTRWVRCWKSATGPMQEPGWKWEAVDLPVADLVEARAITTASSNEEIRAHLRATGWTLSADGWWHSPAHASGISVFAIRDDRFDQEPALRDPGVREILRAEAADYGR